MMSAYEHERVQLQGVERCQRIGTRCGQTVHNAKTARRCFVIATAQQHNQK